VTLSVLVRRRHRGVIYHKLVFVVAFSLATGKLLEDSLDAAEQIKKSQTPK
jgi:hypothetical protein